MSGEGGPLAGLPTGGRARLPRRAAAAAGRPPVAGGASLEADGGATPAAMPEWFAPPPYQEPQVND